MQLKPCIIYKGEDAPISADLYAAFRAAALRQPDKLAVQDQSSTLTYKELLGRADRIASGLMRHPGQAPMRIVSYLGRCIEHVALLFATLRTGNILIPVDPYEPSDRLAAFCNAADSDVVIVKQPSPCRTTVPDCAVISIDDLVDLAPVSSAPVFVDDAFIFFTSGSTGNPKGVWVSQSAVFNSLTWRKSLHDVLASDVFMFKSPAGFDISLWEMLLPLLNGASLIIARPLGHVDMTYLVETIIRKNITIIQFAAPLLQQFVKVAIDVKLTSLRVILCGGEAWEGNLANIVMATFSNVRLFNIYGQTETALGVLAFECDRHKTFQSVPCRNICFNTHLALIEEDGNSITSYDQPGELVVGGVPVSSGYVGGDVATAKSFLEIDTIGRFYRTGDYFVRKENGDWLFLGRRDNQIKLHGVRIELGEIENAASVVPGVAACVAVFSQASRSEIVLFVVSADPALTPKIIRSHIRRRLRGVMVPDRIEFIHSIPLTPNGKVNRNALTGQLKVS